MIRLKRVYEDAEADDGVRFLVERLWPRGMRKDDLVINDWLKDVAPSVSLRRWFSHDPGKWDGFQERYRNELNENSEAWKILLEAARRGNVTLLYSARDTEHNSALLLKSFLEEQMRK
jgi:uncharacterized protein YeaO (DUF488 family)